jgi:PAS domain S-box-containing protein
MTEPRELADMLWSLPALLDALDRAGVAYALFARRDGRVDKWYANALAMRQLGYTLEEWLDKPMFEVVTPEERDRVAQLYERLFSDEPTPAAIEVTFVTKAGQTVPIELTAGKANTPQGHVLVLMWSYESVLHPTQLSLLEADRISLVGALAAGFAHETNNPLTSVLLNLRSLRKQLVTNLSDAKQTAALRCLDDITTGAERIASNVRAFQTLASRSSTQPTDLAAVASAVLRLALPTLEPRAHVIRQIFPVRPVAGEESRIGQAVLAMLLFAVSGFASDGADANNQIVVAVEDRHPWVVVEVSDNGRELAPDEAGHAFDPFFRSAVRGAGFGVGLGVARSVATTLGGDVALAPRPGGGAVITMRLPPAPAH